MPKFVVRGEEKVESPVEVSLVDQRGVVDVVLHRNGRSKTVAAFAGNGMLALFCLSEDDVERFGLQRDPRTEFIATY